MSTTGKISQFTPTPKEDPSRRINSGDLTLIQPFRALGFDTLASVVSLQVPSDLETFTSDSHMAHLGRPLYVSALSCYYNLANTGTLRFGSLYDAGNQAGIVTFAASKLLNANPHTTKAFSNDQKFACLSQRMPLEFYSTTYVADEMKQVEGHMRVCLKIDASFQSMVTVSASEPLLSEGAYSIMSQPTFDVLEAMKSVFEGFAVNKGDRGEFIVMLLFTIARDQLIGPPGEYDTPSSRIINIAPFLAEHLFRNPSDLQTLYTDFPNSQTHFNHYIKIHEYAAIHTHYLLLLLSRGAGILCANNQYAIDGINPFLCNGPKLGLDNLGLILWQGKNDSKFTHLPRSELFQAMDVYKLGILENDSPAIPLIRIVFALAAKTSSLTVVRHPPSPQYNAVVYDVWSSGLSPDFLDAVKPSQSGTWDTLLQAYYSWQSIYKDPDEALIRAMNPGAACNDNHWKHWGVPF